MKNKHFIFYGIYLFLSIIGFFNDSLAVSFVLGPSKSLSFLFEGLLGLSNLRLNIPDANNYIWVGIIIHFFCWISVIIVGFVILNPNKNKDKIPGVIFISLLWIVGAIINFSWEVLGTI